MDARSNDAAVISFERASSKPGDNQLDVAGRTILKLIDRAAGVAEQNSLQALEMAQKLSNQLQTAESRVAELEAAVESYREKADRAEQWLHRVYTEIEDRFLRQTEGMRGVPQRRKA
jgi:uncharacterized protein YlxW (UPF0749 family)